RVAKAQLVGWLEGLFHGIQATLFAQQMAARQQLDEMRRRLPPGVPAQSGESDSRPGTYL
ncbi:MAG TPA: proteasome activator, partial [Actinomycetota bacterium]|nr:proteasome activator [Actinomycetota bacterium]